MTESTTLTSLVGGEMSLSEVGSRWEFETPEEALEWTRSVGTDLVGTLSDLADRTPGITSAMVSTSDGLHVCSLGVDQLSVGQLAALISSLHSLANASVRTAELGGQDEADSVIVTVGDTLFLARAIGAPEESPLVLFLAATGTTLGVLLHHAQATVEQIRELLAED